MSCRTERCDVRRRGAEVLMHGIRAVDVRLEDRGGVMLCRGIKYMYVSRASVEAVRPSAGVVGRSMEVTVMKTRFAVVGTRRAVSCRWSGGRGSRDVEGRVLSSTWVTCQSPERGVRAA
jgi:hypothetical protein